MFDPSKIEDIERFKRRVVGILTPLSIHTAFLIYITLLLVTLRQDVAEIANRQR